MRSASALGSSSSARRDSPGAVDPGPGPGQYEGAPPFTAGTPGGRFNMSNPKSDIAWMAQRAAQLPGPGMYDPPSLPLPKGGRINESRPKSKLEWIEYFAKELPGPGVYEPPSLRLPEGGRFNESRSKGWLDWAVYRTREMPSSCSYDPTEALRRLSPSTAARFQGKLHLVSHQTTLPDAVQWAPSTLHHAGPAECRSDGSFGRRQWVAGHRSSPVLTFAGTRRARGAEVGWRARDAFERYFGYSPLLGAREPGLDAVGARLPSVHGQSGAGEGGRRRRRRRQPRPSQAVDAGPASGRVQGILEEARARKRGASPGTAEAPTPLRAEAAQEPASVHVRARGSSPVLAPVCEGRGRAKGVKARPQSPIEEGVLRSTAASRQRRRASRQRAESLRASAEALPVRGSPFELSSRASNVLQDGVRLR